MQHPSGRHLAQINIGRLVADPASSRVAPFMAAIDRINGLGKRAPGFVWMMEGSGAPNAGNTEAKINSDPRFIVNLTVWSSVEALADFAFNTVHRQFYSRRESWFEPISGPHFAMWWVPAGHRPTLPEGLERVARLAAHGDSAAAFGWAACGVDLHTQRCEVPA